MKVAIVFVLGFASVLALTGQELREKFDEAHAKCNADPAVELHTAEVVKYHQNGGPEPAHVGVHALCISKALGWQDANGKLQKEELKSKMVQYMPADQLKKVSNECLVEKENEIETAKHLIRCYRANRGPPEH